MATPAAHITLCVDVHTEPPLPSAQSETNPGWSVVVLPFRKDRTLSLSAPQAPERTMTGDSRCCGRWGGGSELKNGDNLGCSA